VSAPRPRRPAPPARPAAPHAPRRVCLSTDRCLKPRRPHPVGEKSVGGSGTRGVQAQGPAGRRAALTCARCYFGCCLAGGGGYYLSTAGLSPARPGDVDISDDARRRAGTGVAPGIDAGNRPDTSPTDDAAGPRPSLGRRAGEKPAARQRRPPRRQQATPKHAARGALRERLPRIKRAKRGARGPSPPEASSRRRQNPSSTASPIEGSGTPSRRGPRPQSPTCPRRGGDDAPPRRRANGRRTGQGRHQRSRRTPRGRRGHHRRPIRRQDAIFRGQRRRSGLPTRSRSEGRLRGTTSHYQRQTGPARHGAAHVRINVKLR